MAASRDDTTLNALNTVSDPWGGRRAPLPLLELGLQPGFGVQARVCVQTTLWDPISLWFNFLSNAK